MLCSVKKGFCVQILSEMARWCRYMATRCLTVYLFVCLSRPCCLCKWIVCTDMSVTISSASSALWTVSTGPNFCGIQKNCQLSHNGWPRTHTDTHKDGADVPAHWSSFVATTSDLPFFVYSSLTSAHSNTKLMNSSSSSNLTETSKTALCFV